MSHNTNFLQEIDPTFTRPSKQKRRVFRFVFWGVFVGFILWLIAVLIAGFFFTKSVFAARASLERAVQFGGQLELDAAEDALKESVHHLEGAEKTFLVLGTLRVLPWVGVQVETVQTMVDSGHSLIDGLVPLIDLARDLKRLSGETSGVLSEVEHTLSSGEAFDALTPETKRAVLARLSESAPELDALLTRMHIARIEFSSISRGELAGPLLDILAPIDAFLAESEDQLELLALSSQVIPGFFGLGEEQTHLLLFLNNDELRPGGGFIGTYGLIQMKDGEILSLETEDVYALDGSVEGLVSAVPPVPLQTYNATDVWYLRDANWSPDFARSSRAVIDRLTEESRLLPEERKADVPHSQVVHGVIGFTPTFASSILELTGPIQVGEQTFTSENVPTLIEYEVERGFNERGIPYTQRKEILSDLVDATRERLLSFSLEEMTQVLTVAADSLQEKQLIFYHTDTEMQDVLDRAGWAGRLGEPTGDALLVVDANLASLKSDPEVHRTITYTLEPDAQHGLRGRVEVLYDHQGGFDWRTTRYRTYTRVYVPEGATLLGSSGVLVNDKILDPSQAPGTVDVSTDLGWTVFGAFTSIEPGTQKRLSFEFVPSDAVKQMVQDGAYDLRVQKQLGARDHALTLDLDFGKTVRSASPAEEHGQWGDHTYRLNTELDQDTQFHVEL